MNGSSEPVGPPRSVRARPGAGQIIGELLLTVGVLLALFVIYESFWTNLASGRLQDEAAAQLDDQWSQHPAATIDPAILPVPELGQAFARIHLPTLGEDATYTVLQGTRNKDLRTGPGHYVETQMPGEPGNFALAGHRNGSGAVFQHLDQLHSCDAVVVETETQWMTYRVLPVSADGADEGDGANEGDGTDGGTDGGIASDADRRLAAAEQCLTSEQTERVTRGDYSHVQGRHITSPTAVEVIEPMPGLPTEGVPEAGAPEQSSLAESGAPRSDLERMITLTTCHPEFSNAERMIIHAMLVETTAKSDGYVPDSLKEG